MPWESKKEFLNDFSYTMMISGYSSRFRFDIIKGVVERYRQLREERSLKIHMGFKEIRRHKESQKGGGADNWFINEEVLSYITVPASHGE